ncbi:MAG: RHS repeat-associated core domain-containing protein [Bryobacteraceae bacterium]
MTSKVSSNGTPASPQVDPNTNRARVIGDYGFDANGNWLGVSTPQMILNTWNVENQLIATAPADRSGNLNTYTYDPWGKRVMQFYGGVGFAGSGTVYFYSITGQRLGSYQLAIYPPIQLTPQYIPQYFGKRMLVAKDRLGSVRNGQYGATAYFPWGEERTPTTNGADKFATYFRDGVTDGVGQDYANARYYNYNFGRFWSPDPKGLGSARPLSPGSWNRYTYSRNDPVNFRDPSGLDDVAGDGGDNPEGNDCLEYDDSCGGGGGGDGGGGDAPYTISTTVHCPNTFGVDGCVGSPPVPPDPDPTSGDDGDSGDGQQTPITFGSGGNRNVPVSGAVMKWEWKTGMALARRLLAKDPQCAALFGRTGPAGNTSPDPLTVLTQIQGSEAFGPLASNENYITNATTAGTGSVAISIGNGDTMLVNSGVTITLNNITNGASFVTGNVMDWAQTILHELGHAYADLYGLGTSAIQPDLGNSAASVANNNLIQKNCK